jgi:uncharacterized protein (TIGR02246 family)
MKKPLMILSLVLVLCFTYTCQKGKDIIDVEADIAAVKSLVDEWYSAYYARDIDKILSFYTEDAIRMGHNEPKQVGKKAIQASLEEQMDKYDSQVDDDAVIDDRAEDVRVSGNLGIARGVDVTISPQEGTESMKSTVRWVATFERQADNTWKIVWEIWNKYTQIIISPEKE